MKNKKHSFFEGVKWSNLHEQTSPFIPKLTDLQDTRYFDDIDENEIDSTAPASKNGSLKMKDGTKKSSHASTVKNSAFSYDFSDFSFVRHSTDKVSLKNLFEDESESEEQENNATDVAQGIEIYGCEDR
eukprot:UN05455